MRLGEEGGRGRLFTYAGKKVVEDRRELNEGPFIEWRKFKTYVS